VPLALLASGGFLKSLNVPINAVPNFDRPIHWSGGPPGLLPFAAFAAILLVLNIGFAIYSRRLPFHDTRPTPAMVRYSFAGFSLALLLAGAACVVPHSRLCCRVIRTGSMADRAAAGS
jgi:hypothetical protein